MSVVMLNVETSKLKVMFDKILYLELIHTCLLHIDPQIPAVEVCSHVECRNFKA